jgi:tRNA 2-selenouridine synthase
MKSKKIDIGKFLELAESIPVIDVRSPFEFTSGHIPGAINIPLFDDEERRAVGTKYRQEGRVQAVLEGLKFTGPSMVSKLEQAFKHSVKGKLLVHCWRGGMRSEAIAWLFSLGGIKTQVLEGGYKSYRRHILEKLSEKRKLIVLGGMTGSSKTHILRVLKEKGQQVIDLEEIANHKGSAFGSLGQPPQPSTEQFSNNLFDELKHLKQDFPVWLEDESRNIGSVFLPESFYLNMQENPTIVLLMDLRTRLPRLMEEYSVYPPESLNASIMKISKRLGGDNTREALDAIKAGNIEKAIEITLHYYDKAYLYGLKKKNSRNLIYIETDTDDIEVNALKILESAGKLKL